MKSERVTRTWEFYRDNCDGFKEPMRRELRKLDDYVSSIEAENAKLRRLLKKMFWHMVNARWHEKSPNPSAFADSMRELGVEVSRC